MRPSTQAQPATGSSEDATPQALQSTCVYGRSPVVRWSSWVFALGLVVTQLATVLAGSKSAWFAGLVVSMSLFGCLALSKFFAVRVDSVNLTACDDTKDKHDNKDKQDQKNQKNQTDKPARKDQVDSDGQANRSWNWFSIAAMGLVLLAGLVKAPHRSNDVYAYGAYGRLVSEHSVSPYTTRPSAFPDDPVIARMASGWRNTRSVYGPAFTAVSAAGMRLAGTSDLRERLWFQTLAAVATGLSALLLKRMSPRNWWLFALNPVTLIVVAHEGHNDALVGLGILSALWFVEKAQARPRGSSRLAHGAIGSLVFAASIKITAVFAAPALVVFILGHWGWKRAAKIGAPWALVCVGAFVATGGPSALGAFRGLRTVRSTTSLWHLDLIRRLTDSPRHSPGMLALTIPAIAIVLTGLAVLWRSWSSWQSCWSRDSQPLDSRPLESFGTARTQATLQESLLEESQGPDLCHPHIHNHPYDFSWLVALTLIPLVVFIALGLYVLPWYWGWLLAPAILLPGRFRFIVLLCAAAHSVAYGAGIQLHGTLSTMLQIARFGAPLAFVVVLVASVNVLRRSLRSWVH